MYKLILVDMCVYVYATVMHYLIHAGIMDHIPYGPKIYHNKYTCT